jgi:predicted ester cyclase
MSNLIFEIMKMSTEETRTLIQEYFDFAAKHSKQELIDKYVADEHLKGHIILFEAGLPGYQFIPQDDMIVEGNRASVRIQVKGVHLGELFGVKPTGNKVSVEAIIIYEVEDGKIVNHWMQADSVGLMQQIGAMQEAS